MLVNSGMEVVCKVEVTQYCKLSKFLNKIVDS